MTPTPGQVAYAAYAAARYPEDATHVPMPFAHLSRTAQRAWEAAAQAVLAQWDTQHALAADVYDAAWAQIARCDCDTAHRAPIGSLCASCESLKSIADAAQAVLARKEASRVT